MNPVFSYTTLQALYEAARKVLDESGSPELLRQPLEELDEMVEFRESARGQEVLEEACDRHGDFDSDVVIDDATVVYHNETDGYWVMGWCFVPDSDDDEGAGEEDVEPPIDNAGNQLLPDQSDPHHSVSSTST